jgi:hypothetical protein
MAQCQPTTVAHQMTIGDLTDDEVGEVTAAFPQLRPLDRHERSARPATVTLSRTTALATSAPAFPARPRPRNRPGPRPGTRGCTPGSAARVKPGTRRRRGPSVEQPTVRTDRDEARIPSAMRPWTPRHAAPQRYKMTHHGTEKKRPA